MACGLPVIGPLHSGLNDYLNDKNGYPVEFDLVPLRKNARWLHENGFYNHLFLDGYVKEPFWAECQLSSLRQAMRRAFEDRKELKAKSKEAVKTAKDFTWQKTTDKLVKYLEGL